MPTATQLGLLDLASIQELYTAFPLLDAAPSDETYHRCSEASSVELRDGTVLLAYGRHAGASDNAAGHIWGRTIEADGTPRADDRILVRSPEGGLNAMSPALRRLPDGRLGMLYSFRVSVKTAERHFVSSKDEGRTWSAPAVVGTGGYVTGCHDRFTVHSSGRLIAPLHGSENWDYHWPQTSVAYSDDLGATWTRSPSKIEMPKLLYPGGRIVGEGGANEPSAAERADGSLLMTLRTSMGTQFRSESFDRGETWSSPRSMEVLSPRAPANITRVPGRDELLLVYQHDYELGHVMNGQRHTLVAALSSDGGHSWPYAKRKLLACDPAHSIDYPSVMYKGGEVWITMRCSTGREVLQGRTSTRLMRVPLEWLYEG